MIDANKAKDISSKKKYEDTLDEVTREINSSVNKFCTSTKILLQTVMDVEDWIINQIISMLDLKGFDVEVLSNGDVSVKWGHCNVKKVPKAGFKQFKSFDDLSAKEAKKNAIFKAWLFLEESIARDAQQGRNGLHFSNSFNDSTRDVIVKELERLGYRITLKMNGLYNSFMINW